MALNLLRQNNGKSRIVLLTAGIILLLLCAVPVFTSSTVDQSQKDNKAITSLMISATQFKQMAHNDYAVALLTLATPRGMAQLNEIDLALWSPEQSQAGWQLFFDGGMQIYSLGNITSPLIGYYNPYSDTVLITKWQAHDEIYKISDAELIQADWLHRQSNELSVIPRWLRKEGSLPLALGISVAETTAAFETVFSSKETKQWRQQLSVLNNDSLKSLNYHAAALTLNDHLINQLNYQQPNTDTMATVQRITGEIVTAAINGTIKNLLPYADKTPQNTVQRLRQLPPQWFASLSVRYAIETNTGSLVFLSPNQGANSLAIYLEGTGNRLRVRRFDLVDYQHIYTQLYPDSRYSR